MELQQHPQQGQSQPEAGPSHWDQAWTGAVGWVGMVFPQTSAQKGKSITVLSHMLNTA